MLVFVAPFVSVCLAAASAIRSPDFFRGSSSFFFCADLISSFTISWEKVLAVFWTHPYATGAPWRRLEYLHGRPLLSLDSSPVSLRLLFSPPCLRVFSPHWLKGRSCSRRHGELFRGICESFWEGTASCRCRIRLLTLLVKKEAPAAFLAYLLFTIHFDGLYAVAPLFCRNFSGLSGEEKLESSSGISDRVRCVCVAFGIHAGLPVSRDR